MTVIVSRQAIDLCRQLLLHQTDPVTSTFIDNKLNPRNDRLLQQQIDDAMRWLLSSHVVLVAYQRTPHESLYWLRSRNRPAPALYNWRCDDRSFSSKVISWPIGELQPTDVQPASVPAPPAPATPVETKPSPTTATLDALITEVLLTAKQPVMSSAELRAALIAYGVSADRLTYMARRLGMMTRQEKLRVSTRSDGTRCWNLRDRSIIDLPVGSPFGLSTAHSMTPYRLTEEGINKILAEVGGKSRLITENGPVVFARALEKAIHDAKS